MTAEARAAIISSATTISPMDLTFFRNQALRRNFRTRAGYDTVSIGPPPISRQRFNPRLATPAGLSLKYAASGRALGLAAGGSARRGDGFNLWPTLVLQLVRDPLGVVLD